MTFKNYFKNFFKEKLQEKLNDYNINVTYDKNYFYSGNNKFQKDDLVVILSLGNDIRTSVSDEFDFYSGSMMISFYVYDKEKAKVHDLISEVLTSLSTIGSSFIVGDIPKDSDQVTGYNASFNFNSLASDSLTRIYDGLHVEILTCISTYSYFNVNHKSLLSIPAIYINDKELKNVFSYQVQSNVTTKDFNIQGSRFVKRYEDVDNITYTIGVILDTTDDLHNQLISMTNKYLNVDQTSFYSNFMKVKIEDHNGNTTGNFDSFLSLSSTYGIGNFTALTIVVNR